MKHYLAKKFAAWLDGQGYTVLPPGFCGVVIAGQCAALGSCTDMHVLNPSGAVTVLNRSIFFDAAVSSAHYSPAQ